MWLYNQQVYTVGKEFIVIFRLLLAAVLLNLIHGHFLLWIKNVLCEREWRHLHNMHSANEIQSDVSLCPKGLNMIKILWLTHAPHLPFPPGQSQRDVLSYFWVCVSVFCSLWKEMYYTRMCYGGLRVCRFIFKPNTKPADYTDLVFVVFGNEIQQRTWFCSWPVIQTA